MRRLMLGVMLLMSMTGTTMGGFVYTYGGDATGVIADVSAVPLLSVASTGPLPATGGAIDVTVASANLDLLFGTYNVLSTGILNSKTSGGVPTVGVTNSESSVTGISLLNGLITANAVGSTASAFFNGVSGSSNIANLRIGGVLVDVTGAANQTVAVELLGVTIASLVINQQVQSISPDGTSTSMTVNALHLTVLDGVPIVALADVIIAQSRATIVQAVPEPSSLSMLLGAFAIGGGVKLVRRQKQPAIS